MATKPSTRHSQGPNRPEGCLATCGQPPRNPKECLPVPKGYDFNERQERDWREAHAFLVMPFSECHNIHRDETFMYNLVTNWAFPCLTGGP